MLHKNERFEYNCNSGSRPAIHLSRNSRKRSQNAIIKKCSGRYFVSLFFILCKGRHLRKKSKDFSVYFFPALIKHEIRMKYEKCIVSVMYFVVCFAKTFAKYSRNAKYEKCIASLTDVVNIRNVISAWLLTWQDHWKMS